MAWDPRSPIGRAIKNRTPLNQLKRGRFGTSLKQKAPVQRATTAPAPTQPRKEVQMPSKSGLAIGSHVGRRLVSAGKAQRY